MNRTALLAALTTVLVPLACKPGPDDGAGWKRPARAGSSSPPITGWEPGCAAAFAAAPGVPAVERFAILANACPVCGADWAPILAATRVSAAGDSLARRDRLDAAVKACGGTCNSKSRDTLLDAIDAISGERTIDRPWKRLAGDCRGLLWPSPNNRFASAPWYVLTQIARTLVGHPGSATRVEVAAPVELPLPGQFTGGNGVELPSATHVLAELPVVHVTVLAQQQMVASAPAVTVGAEGMTLAPGTDAYPGTHLEPAALAAAITVARHDRAGVVALMVPRAASATRVLDIAGVLGDQPVHLAVFGPAPVEGWRDLARVAIPALRAGVKGKHAVIRLGPTGGFGIGERVIASGCTQAALDAADLARRAVAAGDAPIAIAIDPAATVEQLAALLDALGGAGATAVALIPAGWTAWDAKLPICQ